MAIFRRIKKTTTDKQEVTNKITLDGVEYQVVIVYKRVKRLTMKVNQESQLAITAPLGTAARTVFNFINTNEAWVKKNVKKNKERKMFDLKAYGFMHFLGKKYIIKLSDAGRNKLTIDKFATFDTRDVSKANLTKIYKKHMKDQCDRVFGPLIHKWSAKMDLEPKEIKFRHMVSRWGVCNYNLGKLTFNTQLMMFDKSIIEYVIVHELAHMYEPNHSKAYWDTVKRYMPDYKQRIQKMKLGGLNYE